MIKINQTRFGEGKGNCFATCICCLLEIDNPESVPNFCFDAPSNEHWTSFTNKWLINNYKLKIDFNIIDERAEGKKILKGQWNYSVRPPVILGGHNHNGIMHAVIYCPDNTIWNPNPNCKGLVDVVDFVYLIPTTD